MTYSKGAEYDLFFSTNAKFRVKVFFRYKIHSFSTPNTFIRALLVNLIDSTPKTVRSFRILRHVRMEANQ